MTDFDPYEPIHKGICFCPIRGVGECACQAYPVGALYSLGGEPIMGRRKLRSDLTDEQKEKALRVGRIGDQFKSAGAVRQR